MNPPWAPGLPPLGPAPQDQEGFIACLGECLEGTSFFKILSSSASLPRLIKMKVQLG